VNIDKHRIMELLHGDGRHDQAAQVANTMPDTVDTDDPHHQDLFSKLGLNLGDFAGRLGRLGNLL
jgi:hypothetical protein